MEYPRPEVELLLRCVSPERNEERAERIRELSGQNLDWEYLLHAADAHAVTPLLYWALNGIRPEAVPAALARRFQDNTRRCVQMTAALFELLDLFAGQGIDVLPFKGPTLAVGAYGNLALRRFMDLDLLVRKEDAVRARAVLLQKGYTTELELKAKWEAAYLRIYDEFWACSPEGIPFVEVHWAVTPRYFCVPLDIAPFWGRAVPVPLGNREVPALCAEDLFLVLCLHGTKHCWTRLSMVADLAWLMAKGNIRWDEVLDQARKLGSLRMIHLGAGLAAELLDIPLPLELARSIGLDRGALTLTALTVSQLVEGNTTLGSPAGNIFKAGLYHVRAREQWPDRVRYLIRLTTTASVEDWQWVDLPSGLFFLYKLLRFPRLIWKYRPRLRQQRFWILF